MVPAVCFLLARHACSGLLYRAVSSGGINMSMFFTYISISCGGKDSKHINKSTIYFILIIVINFFKFTQREMRNFT